MNTVVISWNPGEDKKKWDAFRKTMEKIFVSIKTDSFVTDKKHIFFATDKDMVDSLIGHCSVLICPEELGGKSVGTGTLKAWKKHAPEGIKVITVLDGERYGGGKLKGLFDNGFLDALFEKDFKMGPLLEVIKASRTEAEAFAYYGLDGFIDKKVRKKKALEKKTLEEAAKATTGADVSANSSKPVNKDKKIPKTAPKEALEETPKKDPKKAPREDGRDSAETPAESASAGIEPVSPADTPSDTELNQEAAGGISVTEGKAEEPLTVEKSEGAAVEPESADSSVKETTVGSDTADISVKETPVGSDTADASVNEAPVGSVSDRQGGSFDMPAAGSTASETEDNRSTGAVERKAVGEVVDFESRGAEPSDEEDVDDLKIFTLPEDSLVTYLKECDSEAHSYVRPYPELTKTDRMLEELLDYYTVQNNTWIQNVNNNAQVRDQFEAELRQRIAANDLDLTVSEREQVFDEFSRFLWRYDILEPYILDPDVSDIKVYDPWTVQIKVRGKKMAAPTTFRSNLHYRGFIGRIARKNHVDINNKGLARFADTLTYSEVRLRGNIATELLNCNGSPLIHMRKVNNTKFTTEKLIALKMMTPATAAYLVWCIRNGKSIVFCGKGSSGKTTITNWLIDFFPLWLSALCIQEIDELYSVTHPYIQFQQITSDIELLGDTEGKQRYTLRDLAINGLLTDIDAFLIGEIKGPEALQFTNSANTGNQCLCTVHAEHEREALPQIADYSKFGSDYSRADLLKRLTSIDVVVFMQDFQVKSISEVTGWDEDKQDIVYRSVPIVVPEKIGVEEKHKIMGAERRLFRHVA